MTFLRNTRRKAFTLLEVMLAITLLSIIVAGIFGIIDAGFNATMELTNQQRRSQEFLGLQHLMRATLRELPAEVGIESRTEEAAGDDTQQLVLRDATGVLDWGITPIFDADVVLTTRKQPGGLRTLTVYHLDPLTNQTDEFDLTKASRQLDLVEDLKEVTFRYYYARGDRWFEAWRAGGPRPDLIEMNVLAAEDEEPRRYVFYMPTLAEAGSINIPTGGDGAGNGGGGDGAGAGAGGGNGPGGRGNPGSGDGGRGPRNQPQPQHINTQ